MNQSAFLTPHCLINASLSLGGNVAHRCCCAAWWTFASVPGKVVLAALHCSVCVVLVKWDIPVAVTPHQKHLPSEHIFWESDWFFPVPVQDRSLPWNTIPSSTTSNCRYKDCSKLARDNLCVCHVPQLISDGEKGLPSKAENDDYMLKTQRGYFGESNGREKCSEIMRKNMSMQKMGPLKCTRSI